MLCISSTANGNDSKKFKGDIRSPGIPSRVIHMRKLPDDINEAEVISLGLSFGKVTNLLMLKGKNQVSVLTCISIPELIHLIQAQGLQQNCEMSGGSLRSGLRTTGSLALAGNGGGSSSRQVLSRKEHVVLFRDGFSYCILLCVQAFIEMNTEDAAQAMVSYYASVTPVIRNHPIFLQYSNHQELKTDNSPNQVVSHVHVVCILLNCSQPFLLRCTLVEGHKRSCKPTYGLDSRTLHSDSFLFCLLEALSKVFEA